MRLSNRNSTGRVGTSWLPYFDRNPRALTLDQVEDFSYITVSMKCPVRTNGVIVLLFFELSQLD